MKHLKTKIPMYFIGLFVMTIGIALSVKSNLGVSPVSSIPYTMTCVWGIEMGKATILFHIVLVLIQILLLRKNFKPVQLLQVLIGVVFGYFTTFCNYLVSFLPTPENLGIRIVMVLASTVFVALGIFLYLPANLIPLAGEGCMQAVSSTGHLASSAISYLKKRMRLLSQKKKLPPIMSSPFPMNLVVADVRSENFWLSVSVLQKNLL